MPERFDPAHHHFVGISPNGIMPDGAMPDGIAAGDAPVPFGAQPFGIIPAAATTLPLWSGAAAAPSEATPGASTATGGSAPAPAAVTPPPSGLVIDVSYDSSVSNASTATQQGISAAVGAAVQYLDSVFTNPVTLAIGVGWGEVGGMTTPFSAGSNGLVSASFANGNDVSYANLLAALQASRTSAAQIAAVAALPSTDPTGGSGNDYFLAQAEAKALGIAPASPNALDGAIGLNSSDNLNFDPTQRASSGYYDAVGAIEHEITEVMGRRGYLGTVTGAPGIYAPIDLFRYTTTSSGAIVRDLGPANGSFSVSGQTLLTAYNNPMLGGDAADWATVGSATPPDAFNAFMQTGFANTVSATDLLQMNVLGYDLAAGVPQCFAAGTSILTPRGAVPVEALAVGDCVLARFAGAVSIRWIGSCRIDCRTHPDPDLVCPVRIAADAFGPGCPARPLRLSPEHAVAVGEVLVPIRLLCNGTSIVQERDCGRVRYFHLELDRHDLVAAEGLAAETYLPAATGVRRRRLIAHEDAAAQAERTARSCLPLACTPAAVEPLWRAIAARTGPAPAPPTTPDPALGLGFAGRRLAPVRQRDGHAVFAVPPGEGAAVLLSRSVVPAALRPWVADRRRLGVRVRHLALRRGEARIEMAPDDPRLACGWWAPEHESAAIWRWTDGAAQVPLPCGGAVLEVWLDPAPAYPAE